MYIYSCIISRCFDPHKCLEWNQFWMHFQSTVSSVTRSHHFSPTTLHAMFILWLSKQWHGGMTTTQAHVCVKTTKTGRKKSVTNTKTTEIPSRSTRVCIPVHKVLKGSVIFTLKRFVTQSHMLVLSQQSNKEGLRVPQTMWYSIIAAFPPDITSGYVIKCKATIETFRICQLLLI